MLQLQKKAQLLGHNGSVFSVIPTEKDNIILSGAGDGWVVRWDLHQPDLGKLIAKVETQIFSMAYLPEIRLLVVGNMNGGVHWIDPEHPEHTRNIAHHKKGVFAIQPVGTSIFTAGGDGLLTRWSIEEMRTLESIQLSNQSLRTLIYSESRRELVVGASDHSIYFIDSESMQLKHTIANAHDNSVFSLCYGPDERYLLSGGRDAFLKAWSLDGKYECLTAQPGHWFTINAIALHPSGRWLATASRDKTTKIWDTQDFKLLKVIETVRDQGHINSVNCLHWSSHSDWLITGSDDRRLIAWDIQGNG